MSYQNVNHNFDDTSMMIDDDVEEEFIVNDEDDHPSQSQTQPQQQYQGFGGGGYNIPEPPTSTQVGSERLVQRRFMGGDTLDEPVYTTLLRDFKAVGLRLRQTVWRGANDDNISTPTQQWDLWGPLIFCLMISTALSMMAPNHQSSIVFSGMFALIWVGQAIVTMNIKLLGGTISFFHALCVTGYSLFPLVAASVLSAFVKHRLIRLPVDTVFVAWAIYSTTTGLKHSGVLESRVFLATFPVGLLFAGIGWLCVVT